MWIKDFVSNCNIFTKSSVQSCAQRLAERGVVTRIFLDIFRWRVVCGQFSLKMRHGLEHAIFSLIELCSVFRICFNKLFPFRTCGCHGSTWKSIRDAFTFIHFIMLLRIHCNLKISLNHWILYTNNTRIIKISHCVEKVLICTIIGIS